MFFVCAFNILVSEYSSIVFLKLFYKIFKGAPIVKCTCVGAYPHVRMHVYGYTRKRSRVSCGTARKYSTLSLARLMRILSRVYDEVSAAKSLPLERKVCDINVYTRVRIRVIRQSGNSGVEASYSALLLFLLRCVSWASRFCLRALAPACTCEANPRPQRRSLAFTYAYAGAYPRDCRRLEPDDPFTYAGTRMYARPRIPLQISRSSGSVYAGARECGPVSARRSQCQDSGCHLRGSVHAYAYPRRLQL